MTPSASKSARPKRAALRVGVIGCGLIGSRRARIAASAGDKIVVCVDLDEQRALAVASEVGARSSVDWREAVGSAPIDIVVVATENAAAPEIVVAALSEKKHVLCEKPMGRNGAEARAMLDAEHASGRILKIGFNHRFHPALRMAHDQVLNGSIGKVFAIRAAYGHGGRQGYEKEWRTDPVQSGGGELLDQGVHVIDLARWFAPDEFVAASGMIATSYWPIQPVEDNAFVFLRTAGNATASIHTSWTQWRNLFRFEVLGTGGLLTVDGLGASYGEERLTLGIKTVDGTAPTETHWSFGTGDESWIEEWREFANAIRERRAPNGSAEDGYAAALLIDAIYESARSGRVVSVPQ